MTKETVPHIVDVCIHIGWTRGIRFLQNTYNGPMEMNIIDHKCIYLLQGLPNHIGNKCASSPTFRRIISQKTESGVCAVENAEKSSTKVETYVKHKVPSG